MAPRKLKKKQRVSTPTPSDEEDDELDITVEANFVSVTSAIKVLVSVMQDFKKSMDYQSSLFDDMIVESKKQTEKMDELNRALVVCQKENSELKSEVVDMQYKLNEMEQYSRNYNIEIKGVPEARNENVYDIVNKISEQLGCNNVAADIELCHRVPSNKRSPNAPPNIIVKFFARRSKERIMDGKKQKGELLANEIGFANSNSKIYVNEHLTSVNKNLFWLARNAKSMGFKFVWTKNGRIFLRKDETSRTIRVMKPSDIPVNKEKSPTSEEN